VDYRPAVTGQYDQEGRKVLPRYVMATKAWEMRRQWFDLKRITERIKYERVQAQGTSK